MRMSRATSLHFPWRVELNGYQVLADPCNGEDDLSVGFCIEDTDAVLAAVRSVGKKGDEGGMCVTCINESEDAPTHGYCVTVM